MVCEHLAPVEAALRAQGLRESFRGQPWSENCREWIYFDAVLDLDALLRRIPLAPCIAVHENRDPRSGTERGLLCREHHDAIMGRHPDA